MSAVRGIPNGLPGPPPSGRYYSAQAVQWTLETCGRSLTPDFTSIHNSSDNSDTMQYGIYDTAAEAYVSGYSSNPITRSYAYASDTTVWPDSDLIPWTEQLFKWWDEVAANCYAGQAP